MLFGERGCFEGKGCFKRGWFGGRGYSFGGRGCFEGRGCFGGRGALGVEDEKSGDVCCKDDSKREDDEVDETNDCGGLTIGGGWPTQKEKETGKMEAKM